MTTPAGWYPLHGEQRYWDGLRWTEHRAPAAAAPAYRPTYQMPMVVTDARTNSAEVAVIGLVTRVGCRSNERSGREPGRSRSTACAAAYFSHSFGRAGGSGSVPRDVRHSRLTSP